MDQLFNQLRGAKLRSAPLEFRAAQIGKKLELRELYAQALRQAQTPANDRLVKWLEETAKGLGLTRADLTPPPPGRDKVTSQAYFRMGLRGFDLNPDDATFQKLLRGDALTEEEEIYLSREGYAKYVPFQDETDGMTDLKLVPVSWEKKPVFAAMKDAKATAISLKGEAAVRAFLSGGEYTNEQAAELLELQIVRDRKSVV